MKQFPTSYEIPCIYPQRQHSASTVFVDVPGSKSITNRALLLATLADGTSTLKGVLFSDDSRHFLSCIQALGFETQVDEKKAIITIKGENGRIPLKEASQYVGSAGTAARFLTAVLGVSKGVYHMDASEQMKKRPMAPLLASLKELGCEIRFEEKEGFFPFTLISHGFHTDHITVNIDHSSQFLSALLIASCLSDKDMHIQVEGSHGMAYIQMTEAMMQQFGVSVSVAYPEISSAPVFSVDSSGTRHSSGEVSCGTSDSNSSDKVSWGTSDSNTSSLSPNIPLYTIPKGQHYKALDYQIEPDVSGACYFYAMGALLQLPILVHNVHFVSLQGDVAFLRVLEKMGCTVEDMPDGIALTPPSNGILHGVDIDMSSFSDQAITLSAIAPFADSPTTIRGIGHIRYQESNRMAAIVTELSKMGIRCEETESSLTIYPGTPKGSCVETYDDHRMAMGFSLIGLRAHGITILNPGCCKKTFENYFDLLFSLVNAFI